MKITPWMEKKLTETNKVNLPPGYIASQFNVALTMTLSSMVAIYVIQQNSTSSIETWPFIGMVCFAFWPLILDGTYFIWPYIARKIARLI